MVWALGNKIDVCSGIVPVADLAAGDNTGHRVHMRNYGVLGVLFAKGIASAGTDSLVLTLQEHDAATSGVSQDLAVVDTYYVKSEASLDGDETWTEVTQSAVATITLTGSTYAALQCLIFYEIEAAQLSDGFEWLSVNIADPGTGGTIPGCLFYITSDLHIMRRPDLLAQPNA
jgi:hypothetical protein